MIRVCTTLAEAGYQVTLVGTKNRRSLPPVEKKYMQKRINPFFSRGFGFFAMYNLRLLIYLLVKKTDIICCIDLDTILPVWLAGKIKGRKLVYDAHEYFSQQKEVISRKRLYKIWHWIEKTYVPKFANGYTVSTCIAEEFRKLYGVHYQVVRNVPLLNIMPPVLQQPEKTIIYQGAINEARGFEYLIPAMKQVNARLLIYGDGNFMEATKKLIIANNLTGKVLLMGKVLPQQLPEITRQSYIGLNLVEHIGMNQYYSLANKFFDFIHSGLPQVTMNFPEYKKVNDDFEVALLIDDLEEENIAGAINRLLNEKELYKRLQQNCFKAREILNWQQEEKKLLAFYNDR